MAILRLRWPHPKKANQTPSTSATRTGFPLSMSTAWNTCWKALRWTRSSRCLAAPPGLLRRRPNHLLPFSRSAARAQSHCHLPPPRQHRVAHRCLFRAPTMDPSPCTTPPPPGCLLRLYGRLRHRSVIFWRLFLSFTPTCVTAPRVSHREQNKALPGFRSILSAFSLTFLFVLLV